MILTATGRAAVAEPFLEDAVLLTSTGHIIRRHPDDPPGTFRVPAMTSVVGWTGELSSGELVSQHFRSPGVYTLDFNFTPGGTP